MLLTSLRCFETLIALTDDGRARVRWQITGWEKPRSPNLWAEHAGSALGSTSRWMSLRMVEQGRGKSNAHCLRAWRDYRRRGPSVSPHQMVVVPGLGLLPSPQPCSNPSMWGCYLALRILTSSQTSSVVWIMQRKQKDGSEAGDKRFLSGWWKWTHPSFNPSIFPSCILRNLGGGTIDTITSHQVKCRWDKTAL